MAPSNPATYISQQDKDPEEADWLYHEPDFVFVLDDPRHLWINGTHYVSDPDGQIETGQLWMMRDPGFGIIVSEITEVQPDDETATMRHIHTWNDGEVKKTSDEETWNWGEITGDYDRTMGDSSKGEFIREA